MQNTKADRMRNFLVVKRLLILIFILSFIVTPEAFALNDWAMSVSDLPPNEGGENIRIAVIDTGIKKELFEGINIEDGINLVLPGDGTEDKVGHGSAVASIICGSRQHGIPGVSPLSTIVPIVYYTDNEGKTLNGDTPDVIRGIYAAVDDYGCDVINISTGSILHKDELEKAVLYAEEKGVVVVASVGNANLTLSDKTFYPAGYGTVIGVGALREGSLAGVFSMRNNSVMVLAPGQDIFVLSLSADEPLKKVNGTSYSAAYVSGAVALMLSANRSLKPADIRKIICDTASDIYEKGWDKESGFGILQINAALEKAKYPIEDTDDEFVAKAYQKGLMKGTSTFLFEPKLPVTRAMACEVLYRMFGNGAEYSPKHSDVSENDWYMNSSAWCHENGIFGGNEFMGTMQITGEEFCDMVFKITGKTIESGDLITRDFLARVCCILSQ